MTPSRKVTVEQYEDRAGNLHPTEEAAAKASVCQLLAYDGVCQDGRECDHDELMSWIFNNRGELGQILRLY